ncbi:MAG: hypothetical protein V1816_18490 [Pseudomonadota bacterium]
MTAVADQAFVRQMKKKFELELTRKEKEVLEYWKGELAGAAGRRRDLASLTNDLEALLGRMDKRLGLLKNSLAEQKK